MKLEDAYAIIDGIPKSRFNMGGVLGFLPTADLRKEELNNPRSCGTIGCAMGWLAMHPQANAEGLTVDRWGELYWNQRRVEWNKAAKLLFGISWAEAYELFCPVFRDEREVYNPKSGTFDDDRSDKAVWKRRVRRHLKEHKC